MLVEYNRKSDIIDEIERSADNFCPELGLLALSAIAINTSCESTQFDYKY